MWAINHPPGHCEKQMFKLENPSLYVVCKPCISPLLIINVLFQNSVCFILLLKMILESKITTLWCSKYHHLPIYLEVISPLNNHQVSHQYRILKSLIHWLTLVASFTVLALQTQWHADPGPSLDHSPDNNIKSTHHAKLLALPVALPGSSQRWLGRVVVGCDVATVSIRQPFSSTTHQINTQF